MIISCALVDMNFLKQFKISVATIHQYLFCKILIFIIIDESEIDFFREIWTEVFEIWLLSNNIKIDESLNANIVIYTNDVIAICLEI